MQENQGEGMIGLQANKLGDLAFGSVGDAGMPVLAEDDYQGMNYVNFFSLVKLER